MQGRKCYDPPPISAWIQRQWINSGGYTERPFRGVDLPEQKALRQVFGEFEHPTNVCGFLASLSQHGSAGASLLPRQLQPDPSKNLHARRSGRI
jgi:hypothetical protein